jgi:hypothetical protein
MKLVLLATAAMLAAAAVPAFPAKAQSSSSAAFVGVPSSHGGAGVRVHRGFRSDFTRRDRRDRRRDDDAAIGTWVDGGEWALYNNRSWEPDSYNDWWHDRPDRAYPRWMLSNQNCERKWWSGSGWKC